MPGWIFRGDRSPFCEPVEEVLKQAAAAFAAAGVTVLQVSPVPVPVPVSPRFRPSFFAPVFSPQFSLRASRRLFARVLDFNGLFGMECACGQVDCSGDAQGFCRSRQPEAYPHVELFMPANSAKPPAERGSSTSVQVNVRKFVGYYPNLYGLREFLKSSGIQLPS